MSYADTGDDELDYGEGELGDGAAAGVSLGASADDDEMAQEEDYEELYDDVNIGFLEAPAVATGDTYTMGDMDMVDQKSDVKAGVFAADLDTRAREQTQLEATLAAAMPKPSVSLVEVSKGMKIEIKEENKDERGLSTNRHHSESVGNGKDVIQGRQMPLLLSPTTKELGSGYNNGVRQGSLNVSEKTYTSYNIKADLPSGNGDNPTGASLATGNAQGGGHPGSGFAAVSGRATGSASESFKDRGGEEDMSYDRNLGSAAGVSRPAQRDLPLSVADNSRHQLVNDRPATQQQYSGDGSGMLFVGDLQWWTTDAELEAALSEYGRVKNLKFYEERVSGKSKGYCQVEFYDHASAAACKQGMNGRKFHGRPCIVALGNAKSIQQMGYQQEKKTQAQFQAQQEQMNTRRANNNNTGGTRGGSSYQDRDSGRGYGRARGGQGMGNKTGQGGGGRGRGSYMNKGMGAGGGGGGGSGGSGMPYGQGHSGPIGGHQSAMMMHQGMMGQGYDPTYGAMAGRGGAAYGGYVMPAPPFPGMVAPFPGMGPGGLPGVAPHVNPAFFGRPNGMGLMPGSGMEGPHQGMWGDGSMGVWGGEDHDRRARDGSYADDGVSMDYNNYNSDLGHEKSRTGGGWDKENGGLSERYRRDDRDGEWERDSYKERERDVYRDQRDRDGYRDKEDDWDRERTTIKSRSKSRIVDEDDDPRVRSREDDYGRKRRVRERDL